ncbi:DUF4198 domain-containing protein [Cognatishimia activa]|uniref:DUF4198 domain-containing protein n=1 Tax=Cognatishimia activa TaxID=1715691 RepID=UPI00222FCFFA|nr:DUF4198 domain-containing protein [Cognatishimia activa]UZD92022.1 DUF4198 domain-containing protein [Cognatishimia activa]
MRLVTSLVLAVMAATPSLSHEFWIEPVNFQVEPGEALVANFRNGQEFKGGALSWFDRRVQRSELRIAETVTAIKGRSGDNPALSLDIETAGLLRIVHQTTMSTITYREPEKFQDFVNHKDLDTSALLDPAYPISEGYSRFAKSLVAVGYGEGSDDRAGLEIEFVALKNPYTDDLSDGLPLQLFYKDKPRADAQVEMFDRNPSGEVVISLLRADAKGVVTIPVTRGHSYLIDSVVLRRPDAALTKERKLDWESLWAALTFAVPE